jgi:hypothetical protein
VSFFGVGPGVAGHFNTDPPGTFSSVTETGVGPGSWLVIASISAASIAEFPGSGADPFRTICELRDGSVPGNDGLGGFIGGSAITGETSRNPQDRHEITITAGLFVPAGGGKLLRLACASDNGSSTGYATEHGGARVTLVKIGGFFDVSNFPP